MYLIDSVANFTIVPLLGALLVPLTYAAPVASESLARGQNIEDPEWIAPSIVSFDFTTNGEHSVYEKRSGLGARESSMTLSCLGGYLKQEGLFQSYVILPQ
jgi:hypothetical protein